MNQLELRAKEIFTLALDEPEESRSSMVADACGDDTALQLEVESLLGVLEQSTHFLETPALESASKQANGSDDVVWIDRSIGQFTIRSVLASGGMGVVYLADQEQPKRIVAIKMLRSPFPSRASVRRFEYEAEVLGRLQHPNIAQIYEAGVYVENASHGSGTPYLAMEFIDGGIDLVEYAQGNELDLRTRLRLFTQVCNAAHHAHQKGVVHRDLKPSNILVEPAHGEPKIIDFGIARAIELEGEHLHTVTCDGHVIGTLQYASPEQCAGDSESIDVRTDVYSLGAILYELLVDKPALDLSGTSLVGAAAVVQNTEPTRLGHVQKTLRGDLETIVHKAMAKDKEGRYRSAAALGDDITRFLDHEPIAARPPSTIYHVRKFSQRNKALVVGTAASMLILICAVIAISFALASVANQRNVAENAKETAEIRERDAEASRAAEVIAHEHAIELTKAAEAQANFINRVLKSANPWLIQGEVNQVDEGMLRTLDMAAAEVERSFADQPISEGAVRLAMAQTYRGVGRLDDAELHTRRALEIFSNTFGDEHEYTIRTLVTLAAIEDDRGRFDESYLLLNRSNEAANSVPDLSGEIHISLKNSLCRAAIRTGSFDKAEEFAREAIDIAENCTAPTEIENAARLALADALAHQRRYDEAEPLYRELLEKRQREIGTDHLSTLVVQHNLAGLLIRSGRSSEALPHLEKVLAARREAIGNKHTMTLMAMSDLTVIYIRLGQLDKAQELAEESLELHLSYHGRTHPNTGTARNNLAQIYMRKKRYDECAALLNESIGITVEQHGEDHQQVLVYKYNLGVLYRQAKRFDDAEVVFREVVDGRSRVLGSTHALTRTAQHQLSEVFLKLGKVKEARALIDALFADEGAVRDVVWTPALIRRADAACLALEGDIDGAKERYHEAVSMLQNSVGLNNNQAQIVIKAAISFFEEHDLFEDAAHMRSLLQ